MVSIYNCKRSGVMLFVAPLKKAMGYPKLQRGFKNQKKAFIELNAFCIL